MKKQLLLIVAALVLASCVSGRQPDYVYTSPTTGQSTLIQSDKEMCESSCNADYSRCMDTQAASQGDNYTGLNYNGQAAGLVGPAADCRNELSSCLPGCKSR
jgi:hypothetical protein